MSFIHQIWFQKDNIPDIYEKSKNSWVNNHPTHKYILWDKNSIDELVNKTKYFDIYSNYKYQIQKIDIARLIILFEYGGIYSDIDMICSKNTDSLFKDKEIYFCNEKKSTVGTAIIYSEKNNIILQKIIEYVISRNKIKYNNYLSQVLGTTGPGAITLFFKKNINYYLIVDKNHYHFYPILWNNKGYDKIPNEYKNKCYGYHLWCSFWRKT